MTTDPDNFSDRTTFLGRYSVFQFLDLVISLIATQNAHEATNNKHVSQINKTQNIQIETSCISVVDLNTS